MLMSYQKKINGQILRCLTFFLPPGESKAFLASFPLSEGQVTKCNFAIYTFLLFSASN